MGEIKKLFNIFFDFDDRFLRTPKEVNCVARAKSRETICLEIDPDLLSSGQVRLLNTVCHSLYQAMITESEGEYFDGSAEALRMCASLIKQANFGQKKTIPYSDQALEYSLEILRDYISASKLVTYDN